MKHLYLIPISLSLALALLAVSSCASPTQFRGEATTPRGPETCQAQCATWGMELVGMVSMGANYTDGCVCAVPGKAPGALAAVPAAVAGVAGVEMQRQAAAESQRKGSPGAPMPAPR